MKTEEIYEKIFKIIEEAGDKTIFNLADLRRQADNHLFGLELRDKYGLDIDPTRIHSKDWQKLHDNIYIAFFKEGYRNISWPDDGRQPENETLLLIKFPTGAYIFGNHFPTDIFQKFFQELKSYGPKYLDSANKCLYFSLDNAAEVFNNYTKIYKKYKDIDISKNKARRVQQLKKELEELQK